MNNADISILIVDDNQKNIQLLGTLLLQEGYQIYVAQEGQHALSQAQEVRPDLILLDIMMPEMDGWAVCEYLKANTVTKNIPVIFLTAKTESDDIVRGFDMGAVDYITKPFNAQELIARVHTHLRLMSLNNERKELLHIMCHDLANPVSAIISTLEFVKPNKMLSPEAHRLMSSAAQHSLDIIEQVRHMRALEEHKMVVERHHLLSAVQQSVAMLQQSIQEKHLQLEIAVEDTLAVQVEPVSFVNSVLNNLLTNAIKFSYSGSEIRVAAQQYGEDKVDLIIQDNGMGIPAQTLDGLFDWRKTKSRPGTSGETGTGFGMPMVKKFVQAYGGQIEIISSDVNDDPNTHGTTVILHLLGYDIWNR